MTVQLFIKKMPNVIKELISREAADNRRSINQEAIALLEEALVNRVSSHAKKHRSAQVLLEDYASRALFDTRVDLHETGMPSGPAA